MPSNLKKDWKYSSKSRGPCASPLASAAFANASAKRLENKMTINKQQFKKRLEILFKNLGYYVESSMIFQDLIIFDLEFATTHDKINVIYCNDLKTFEKFKEDIKEYSKKNTVLLFNKKVIRVHSGYKIWLLSELADIEKCGYLGCQRFPAGLLVK